MNVFKFVAVPHLLWYDLQECRVELQMAPRSTGTAEVAPSVSGTRSRSRAAAVGCRRKPHRSQVVDRAGQRRGCLGSGSRNYHLQSMCTSRLCVGV